MKARKTLVALVMAGMIAGCALSSRIIYEGEIGDKKVKYEKVYDASLGYEPDYRMTVTFPNDEIWVIVDDNMDRMMKPGEDVVTIIKDREHKKYRGITPITLPFILEADKLYQSMLEKIKIRKESR